MNKKVERKMIFGNEDDVRCDCFFCEWAEKMADKIPDYYVENESYCEFCPGRLVDKKFNCCGSKRKF